MAQLFANNASSMIAADISATENTIQLHAGDGALFPDPKNGDYFLATLTVRIGVEVQWEICKCTARNGDTLTVVRGQEGTTPIAWIAGSKLEARLTAGSIASIYSAMSSTISAQQSTINTLSALVYAGL